MRRSKYEIVKIHTSNMSILWKECRGIAPDSVADKMDDAKLKHLARQRDWINRWRAYSCKNKYGSISGVMVKIILLCFL